MLPENAIGTFNAVFDFKTKLDLKKENKDSFKLNANLNVGDQTVESGIIIKVEVAGNTFTGTLDAKLRDKTDKNVQWKIKANTTKQIAGEVQIQLKVKKANLAAGFTEIGVVPGEDFKKKFELDIPVVVTIGDRSTEVSLDSIFKFNRKAIKAKVSGSLD